MKTMLSGNASAAWGARAANVDYVCAYPITPQSEIVETLASWIDEGRMKARFVNFESEHSMLTAAGAASLTGARVFTSTSSQGLLYGLEVLYTIAGWRAPLVLVNVSRGVGMPMILQVEHGDVLAARDSGFIQLHAETCQEVLDLVLLGYRLAEDSRVMLPVIVNLDGFVLSFAREPVDIPDTELVKSFLPEYSHPQPIIGTGANRVAYGPTTTDGFAYSFFKNQIHLASLESGKIFKEISREYLETFGRKHDAIETFMTDDAEYIFVTSNSYSTNIRAAIKQLRSAGEKVGMVRLKMIRPFPRSEVAEALCHARAVAVFEQNLAPGRGAVLYPEILEALYHRADRPDLVRSFVGGLGGTSIELPEVKFMLEKCKVSLKRGEPSEQPTFLYKSEDWERMRRSLRTAGVSLQDSEVSADHESN